MEAGMGFLSPPPPPPNLPRSAHLSLRTSVAMLTDQASRLVSSAPSTSIVRNLPASVFPQERHNTDEANILNEGNMLQKILVTQHTEGELPMREEKEKREFELYLKYFERRLFSQPGLQYLFPTSFSEETLPYLATDMKSVVSETDIGSEQMEKERGQNFMKPEDVLALAKRAMVASRDAEILAAEFGLAHLSGVKPTVRSKRLLERQSKKRKASKKPKDDLFEVSSPVTTDVSKKIKKGLNADDPLRLFLWGPKTKQLLTIKEEWELFSRIEEHRKLEQVKQRLQIQFSREPTLSEWAEAVGMSCRDLYSSLSSGKRCREKMIYANFRLVIHIAKQYEGKGLNIQDLLQEGSKGLMRSLEKFKPKAGCRFPTYAYWWIRQSIRKAIFQNSRTIRLPENVFAILKKIRTARKSCRQEGYVPTSEELAKRTGIRVERLESLLRASRNPLSIQERAWLDEGVTFQEITADPEVEIPDLVVAKQMMRQHVGGLLHVLSRRDRQIIRLRYGMDGCDRMSLSDIGALYDLSKERVRQLETRAMDRLGECMESQGLDAYTDLLT